jgi:hypothetical protein
MRNGHDPLVGRKVSPRRPQTVEEKQMQLDAVRCGLEAAAAQLRQCGLLATERAVLQIAAQIDDLKNLVARKATSN